PNVAGFLSYDPKDAIVAIGSFIFGPLASVVITVIVSFVEFISISGTGPIGLLMNIISTCAFALPAAVIYKKKHSMGGAIIGLSVGVIFMTACMVLWNYLITPYYMDVPRAVVVDMLLPTFAPFNLIKGGLNMGLTLLLYKPIVSALRRARLVPQGEQTGEKKASTQLGLTLLSLAVLATFAVLFLIFAKVI
ncbi:MAG: ECF transporter S component, partial [Clostridia bacterium]|nr:ECF transporter S component [Clostridia bacterium]